MFYPKDTIDYDELWVTPAAAVVAGVGAVIEDRFGFYLVSSDPNRSNEQLAFIYKMRQVLADKVTGTGEAIAAGDQLYYIVASALVSATAPVGGVAGTDYYPCGTAKKAATASASQVEMRFDGLRYDEDI